MGRLTRHDLQCSSFRDDWKCNGQFERQHGSQEGRHFSQPIYTHEGMPTFSQHPPLTLQQIIHNKEKYCPNKEYRKTLTFYQNKKSTGVNNLLPQCTNHFPVSPTFGEQILKGQNHLQVAFLQLCFVTWASARPVPGWPWMVNWKTPPPEWERSSIVQEIRPEARLTAFCS